MSEQEKEQKGAEPELETVEEQQAAQAEAEAAGLGRAAPLRGHPGGPRRGGKRAHGRWAFYWAF